MMVFCQGGHHHGQAVAHGRALGANPTPVAPGGAEAPGRKATGSGPGVSDRDFVGSAHGDPVGTVAARNGMRQRDALLASPARLARSGHLARHLADVSQRTGSGRRDRLVGGGPRQLLNTGAFWGAKTGPNPTDRGKNGTKRHLITDGAGIPLAIAHTGANIHDSQMAIPLVDAITPITRPRGRPRRGPDALLADRAYDAEEKIRQALRRRGIVPLVAKRNTEHGSGLGKRRYVVEAAFDWLFNQRRLRVRYEKRDDIHDAFLIIGCLLICWNRIQGFC